MSADVDTDADGLEVVHDRAAVPDASWLVDPSPEAADPDAAWRGAAPPVAGPPTDDPSGDLAAVEVSHVVETQLRHLTYLAVATVVVALLGFVLLANTEVGTGLSFAYPTALVGAAGASVNAARRIMRLGAEPLERQRAVPEKLAVLQTWLSPVIGAAFAALLYSMFLAGIVQGEFFPAFACASEPFTDYGTFSSCTPTTNADAAMAIVWGFAAGFAERWVPNILDRFTGDPDRVEGG